MDRLCHAQNNTIARRFSPARWSCSGRLNAGFRNALQGTAAKRRRGADIDGVARFLTISAQGLWSVSRVTPEAGPLRAYVDYLLQPIEERFVQ
jgi:hypothetical protein